MRTVVKHYLLVSCLPMFPITMKWELFVSRSLAFQSASSSILGIENIYFRSFAPDGSQFWDKTEMDRPRLLSRHEMILLFHIQQEG